VNRSCKSPRLGPLGSEDLVAETINDVVEPLIYEEALELIDHHLARATRCGW